MSRIRANTIVDSASTGAPTFPNGAIINGITTITADVATTGNNLTIGTGTTISNPSDNEFRILTNGSERVRVDSSGNVGIGTDNPERTLSVAGNNPMIQIEGTGGSGKQWSIISSDDTTGAAAANKPGNFVIYDDTSGGLGDVLTLTGVGGSMGLGVQDPGAKLHVSSGNIKVDNGFGIDFSATSDATGMTSELLDDYEEGTWTPVGADNFNNITNADGAYIKVGRVCIVNFQFNYSSLDSSSSSSAVTGLPFTPKNDNPNTGVEATNSIFGTNKIVLVYTQNDTVNLYFETDRPMNGSASASADFFRGSLVYMTE